MALPPKLQAGIERELGQVERARLARSAEQISEDYKRGRFHRALSSAESRAAYLITRLPATFAANDYVFREVARLTPEFQPRTMVDLGAGPGTATWAAREVWPELRKPTLIEGNRELLQLGQRLAGDWQQEWMAADIASKGEFPAADLVVLSYALGELQSPNIVVQKAWKATQHVLVLIEPGTPRNFATVAEIRRQLIGFGAHPIAPCPHTNDCPMAISGDWCHFAVRVERTSEHRKLKGGTLGYEDEKFSYLAFSKTPATHADTRIVRHPAIHGGHIKLTLCTSDGLESQTVTRSQKQLFRAARRAEWGDAWPPQSSEDQLE